MPLLKVVVQVVRGGGTTFFHFCLNYLLLNTFLLSFALILYVYSLLLVRDERSLGLITIDEGHGARRG